MNTVTKFSVVKLTAVVISLMMLESASGKDTTRSPLDSPTSKKERSPAEIWEYKAFQLIDNSSEMESELNKLGAEGWELVHISDGHLAVFKRKQHMSAVKQASHVPVDQSVWVGEWDTNWGLLTISVAADGTAIGTYGAAKHKIAAAVDADTPNVLSGRWRHSDSNLTGSFRFELSMRNQFKGRWSFGDEVISVDTPNWTGKRAPSNSAP